MRALRSPWFTAIALVALVVVTIVYLVATKPVLAAIGHIVHTHGIHVLPSAFVVALQGALGVAAAFGRSVVLVLARDSRIVAPAIVTSVERAVESAAHAFIETVHFEHDVAAAAPVVAQPDTHREPTALVTEAPVVATPSHVGPAPALESPRMSSTDPLAHVEAEASSDVSALVNTARQAAKTQAQDAVNAATKLLTMSAGDLSPLLTDGESAAIEKVVAAVPSEFRPIVSAFATQAANAALTPVNASINAGVSKGLAYAEAHLTAFVAAFDHTIGA